MSFNILIVMQIIKIIFERRRQIQQLQLNISENDSKQNSLDIIVALKT